MLRFLVRGLLACLLFGCTPPPRLVLPQLQSMGFVLTRYQLSNGLSVILQEDHSVPLVAVNLWYDVGGRDDPEGRSGLAHLFEHLMFQGSRNVPREVQSYFDEKGVQTHNGTTNSDRTNYFETVPANELEFALWLESDRMGFLLDRLDETNLEREREVVKNEYRQRYENQPYGLVGAVVREELYPAGHPYRRMAIGSPQDLDRVTLDDVRNFYGKYYVPSNASLVLSGDFVPEQARAMVAKYFGSLPRMPRPDRAKVLPVVIHSERLVRLEAGVPRPQVRVTWPSPALAAPGDVEMHIATQYLASALREDLKRNELFESVEVNQSTEQAGGRIEIVATLAGDARPATAMNAIDEDLNWIRRKKMSFYSFNAQRSGYVSTLILGFEGITPRQENLWVSQLGSGRLPSA